MATWAASIPGTGCCIVLVERLFDARYLQPLSSCNPVATPRLLVGSDERGGSLARLDKLARDFRACTGPHPFRDFERMLLAMGYEPVATGKTGGSRRRYCHRDTKHIVMLDEPHDGEMGPGMVRRLQKALEEGGAL
jgi:hypothetical protein